MALSSLRPLAGNPGILSPIFSTQLSYCGARLPEYNHLGVPARNKDGALKQESFPLCLLVGLDNVDVVTRFYLNKHKRWIWIDGSVISKTRSLFRGVWMWRLNDFFDGKAVSHLREQNHCKDRPTVPFPAIALR
jgi:hypothetical protein